MFQLAQLCRAVVIFIHFFNSNKIKAQEIIEFTKKLILNENDFELQQNIEEELLDKLRKTHDSSESDFFYENSPLLKSFFAKIYAASLINLPICITGRTGIGKTSAAREFSRIRPLKTKHDVSFRMHSFHAGTKPKDFFGTISINNENIRFINGSLTNAMENGETFIADEMNLSTQTTMKSLAPALEPCMGHYTYIPGIEKSILINPEFFFIVCQNEIGTLGRNAIPSSIASRFRYFDYPKQSTEETSAICLKIAENCYIKKSKRTITDDDPKKLGIYMVKLNELKQRIISPWSLRDINKILHRKRYQDYNASEFQNITLCKNILFYTLSSKNTDDVKQIFDVILNLLSETFNLSEEATNDLKDSYLAVPTIKSINGKSFIMKGSCGVQLKHLIDGIEELPSLLNGVFQISLSDPHEPILLMGPSCYKTFLLEKFFNSDRAKVITLNQETTIDQLLGSTSFFTKEEAKHFYLKTLSRIFDLSDENYKNLIQKLEDGSLQEKVIDDYIELYEPRLPSSFTYIINHLRDKLFQQDANITYNSVLSNMELEFTPGLFLSSILRNRSLILKNLSNTPTIVLERFNELFSEKHSLTLNEDIHNTFTAENNKEFTDIHSYFRIFATCPPNSATKLSEAILSRFSVINVTKYQMNEQELVLKNYVIEKNLYLNQLHTKVCQFAEKMNFYFGKNFSFTQMINSIDMCSKLHIANELENNEDALGIILYRLGYGLLEVKDRRKFVDIFKELEISLPPNFSLRSNDFLKNNTNPFEYTHKCLKNGIKSKITGLFLPTKTKLDDFSDIAFTHKFNEMLDILHLGIKINIPIIFEGMPGQGKMTAINHMAKVLGIQIYNIIISQSTKVEDLLGKTTIIQNNNNNNNIQVGFTKTKLTKILEGKCKRIIVFHNINSASSAVLQVLESIFDYHQKKVLLPNGSTITKCQVNLIGLFNPQNGIFSRDKLPPSLIFSSLYHIVENPSGLDIFEITKTLFKKTKFNDDPKVFFKNFMKIKEFAMKSNSNPFTLNDIVKYKNFRENSFQKINETFVSIVIFAYRFIHQDIFEGALKIIGAENNHFEPQFDFITEGIQRYLLIRLSDDEPGIKLQISSIGIDKNLARTQIDSLTMAQKHCLLFLAFSVMTKQTCILQGGTASGKSHIIRLFAKILGKKLNVYHMNNETSPSFLSGQSILENKLSDDDRNDLHAAIVDLRTIPEIREKIISLGNNINNEYSWKPSTFTKVICYCNEYKTSNPNEREDIIRKINRAKQKILEILQPARRFKHQQSSFLNAIESGEWVFIDGIESANPEMIEKISLLCGENPELNITDSSNENYYKKAHIFKKGFHLFISYNPESQNGIKSINSSFLSKCASFTLPPIDSTPESAAQILFSTLISKISKKMSIEISCRLAKIHLLAKEDSIINKDSFAGDIQITGRTLIFINKEFTRHFITQVNSNNEPSTKIHVPICYSIQNFYFNSRINNSKKEEFKKKIINAFLQPPDQQVIMKLRYDKIKSKDKNEEILMILKNIQDSVEKKMDHSNFSNMIFVQKCFQIQIIDVEYILEHIKKTIYFIDEKNESFISENKLNIYNYEYYWLKVIENILEDISYSIKFIDPKCFKLCLNDKKLLEMKYFQYPISKITLLIKLVSDNSYISKYTFGALFIKGNMEKVLISVTKMFNEPSLEQFDLFISLIINWPKSEPCLLPIIEPIIPYESFDNTPLKMIQFFIPQFKKLYENKISFNIIIEDKKYVFKYTKSKFTVNYAFSFDTELILLPSSAITDIKNGKEKTPIYFQLLAITRQKKYNSIDQTRFFYFLVEFLISYSKPITSSMLNTKINEIFRNIPKLPKKDNEMSFSLLISQNQGENHLIANIWSILYGFSYEQIDLLKNYIHPLESRMIDSLYKIYSTLFEYDIKEIHNLTKKMLQIGNDQSYLWKVFSKNFDLMKNIGLDIESVISEIDNEIQYLDNCSVNNIWDPYIFINRLNETKNKFVFYHYKSIDINRFYSEYIIKLTNIKLKNKNYDPIKTILLGQITENIQHLDREKNSCILEKLAIYKDQIDRFLEMTEKRSEVDYAQNNIIWPNNHNRIKSNTKTKKIELFNHILWFSSIYRIIDRIEVCPNEELFEEILKLCSFPEMNNAVKYLINSYNNNNEKIGRRILPQDIELLFSNLNAKFLSKLLQFELFDEFARINSIFDTIENRKCVINEEFSSWIYEEAQKYPTDFLLYFPIFQPKDILYLLIDYGSTNNVPLKGPFFLDNYCNTIVRGLSNLTYSNFDNFEQCSDMICQNVIKTIFGNKVIIQNDHQWLKKFLKQQNKVLEEEKQILNIIYQVMEIAEKFDTLKAYNFSFNDKKFLDNNWFNDEEFINKYPSLVYWICKNDRCTAQLRNIFDKENFQFNENSNSFPFVLFVLRIMSSYESIKFDYDSILGNEICRYVGTTIRSIVKEKVEKKEKIGTKWLNVLLSYVPPEISDPNYKLINQFIINLSKHNFDKQEEKYKIKEEILKIIDIVIKMTFDDTFCDLLKIKIRSNNQRIIGNNENNENSQNDVEKKEIISFLVDPNVFISEKISLELDRVYNQIMELPAFVRLDQYVNDIKTKADRLLELSQKEDEKISLEYGKNKTAAKLEHIKNQIKDYIDYYQQINDIYKKKSFVNDYELQTLCEKIINLKKKIPDNFVDDKGQLFIYKRDKTYIIEPKEEEVFLNYIYIYILKPYKDDYNIDENFINNYPENEMKKLPTKAKLKFSKDIEYKEYIKDILLLRNIINQFSQNFQTKNINQYEFESLKDAITLIKKLNIQQYQIDISQEIQILLEDFVNLLPQIKKDLNEIKDEIDNKYRTLFILNCNKGLISHLESQYKLPVLKKIPRISEKDIFKSIITDKLISSPILSVKDNKIVCCFDSLTCTINPMTPSIYSKKISLNLISFIDESIHVNIETDQKYSQLISSKGDFSKDDLVQIFISLPNLLSHQPEDLNIKMNIHITSQTLQELSLPCNISIKLLPISFLIKCKQFKLAYNENSFYLCTDQVVSKTKLNFSLQNYYYNSSKMIYDIKLSSFDDNTAPEPLISGSNNTKNGIRIEIPYVEEVKHLHAAILFKFSDQFSTSIIIDAALIPFDFAFEIYDPRLKQYASQSTTIFYSSNYLPYEINLHCRIYGPSFIQEMKGSIQSSYLKELALIEYKGINENFVIEKSKEFDIFIKINESICHRSENENHLAFIVKINEVSKIFILILTEFDMNIIDQFINYGYVQSSNKWEKVLDQSNEKSKYSCIINPFSISFPSMTYITYYKKYCKVENDIGSNKNIFICINSKEEKMEIKSSSTYSLQINVGDQHILPIYGIINDNWFPAFGEYPILNWNELDYQPENIQKAKDDLENLKTLAIAISSNLFNFLVQLTKIKVFRKLKVIIEKLPNNIKELFDSYITNSNKIVDSDQKMNIYIHNVIKKIYDVFKARYIELKFNFFCFSGLPLSKEEINNKKEECSDEYVRLDQNVINNNSMTNNDEDFNKIINDANRIHIQPKPSLEEQSFVYLYTENTNPIPKNTNDMPNYIDQVTQNQTNSGVEEIKVDLPKIDYPENNLNDISISVLNKLYKQGIQRSRVLPIYVKQMISAKLFENYDNAVDCFYKLQTLYQCAQNNDYSFISMTTELFKKSFVSMVEKFKRAGVNLQPSFLIDCDIKNEITQDFIQIPDYDRPVLPSKEWISSDKVQFLQLPNLPSLLYRKFNMDKDEKINIEISSDIPKETGEKDMTEPINDSKNEDEELPITDLEFLKFISNNNEEEGEKEIQNEQNELNEHNANKQIFVNQSTHKKTVDSEQFEEIKSQFTEINAINRAISRMKEIDRQSNLILTNETIHPFKHDYLKPEKNVFPIINLMEQASFLAQKFIIAASSAEIPFNHIAVSILVDCSSFISDENKIFNMMIICALTNALTALEISYSAAVIADKNFKAIIKPFEEPHSALCLQRICDCLLIKRHRTNLASSIKLAIDSMKWTNNKNIKHRAIFAFTDGLDEQLILTKEWSQKILCHENLSIGFVFVKSSQLVEDNLEFVENVWKTFETEVRDHNALSIVKIASITSKLCSDLNKKLMELFANVMNRKEIIDDKPPENKFEDPLFAIEEITINADIYKNYLNADFQTINEIFVDTTRVLKTANSHIDKLDISNYRNKTNKISTYNYQKIVSENIIENRLLNKRTVDQYAIETIFNPNKASQTILSSTGSNIDITALVLNSLDPHPDPLIFLEEKGGLMKNYSVSIVIDSSYSCFNDLTGAHSFQTIKTILSSLAIIDLPCFDLIVTGDPNPIVICSEVGTLNALKSKSPFWQSLLAVLQRPNKNVDLGSAIHAAFDLRRVRTKEYTNILFVLTDGFYSKSEQERIIHSVNNCVQSGINTFGIGIGIYPKGIEKLFNQVVFSPNPANVIKSISSFYGNYISGLINEMQPLAPFYADQSKLRDAIVEMIQNEKTPSFISLVKELNQIVPTLDAFYDMYNEEKDVGNEEDGFTNPTGKNTEIYVKDLLKGQKILIVMLWDYTLNEMNEENFIHPKYIKKENNPTSECIESAVEHFGISLEIVQNYEDAINKLIHNSTPGYCDYYAVWIFCGPPYPILPDKESDPNLVGQFIEVLIKFWKNGGSLVFWADGDPLNYQVNLFLEKVRFENEPDCPDGETLLRIHNEHEGGGILKGDASGTLSKPGTFNRSPQFFKQCQRTTLSHNIGKIFEGISISYVPWTHGSSLIKPFKPFARDTEGAISSMFYTANLSTGTGDIVIDCGYTKCFTHMSSDGTFRYIQNIAGWTARPEVHKAMDNIEPCDWRPKAIEHELIKGETWDRFESYTDSIDTYKLRTLWAIDSSKSVKDNELYHSNLRKIVGEYFKNGDIIYLWDSKIQEISYRELVNFYENKEYRNRGTDSSNIAQIAQETDCREHLIIVTDGEVSQSKIRKSDEIIKNSDINFQFVTTFIIGNGNLSVGAPYSRKCPNVAFHIPSMDIKNRIVSLTSDDMKSLANIDKINTYKKFEKEYPKLDSAIQAKTLLKERDSELLQKIKNLYHRVIQDNLTQEQAQSLREKINQLQRMADGMLIKAYTISAIAAAKKGETNEDDS